MSQTVMSVGVSDAFGQRLARCVQAIARPYFPVADDQQLSAMLSLHQPSLLVIAEQVMKESLMTDHGIEQPRSTHTVGDQRQTLTCTQVGSSSSGLKLVIAAEQNITVQQLTEWMA